METYLTNLINWLQTNEPSMRIENWFFFRDYTDVTNIPLDNPYAGLHFFEDDEVGSSLNPVGEIYRDFATGVR